MFDLKGRIAIVTGAARGIGFAAAEKLAENGASVVLGDLNEPLAQEAAGRLKAKGYEALAVRMDVGRNDSIREAIAAAVKAFGGIDIVVNNAGILSALSIEEMTREEWDKVLNVNLGGTFFVIQAALPFLKKSQNPRIINISSLTGRNGGFEGSMCYAASKGGVISITRGMARRLAPFNITVNAVCPGPTETEILKAIRPKPGAPAERQPAPPPRPARGNRGRHLLPCLDRGGVRHRRHARRERRAYMG